MILFRDELGYRYLGDWTDRGGNSNIEEEQLSAWLIRNGYTGPQISVALHKLRTEADNHSRTLYGNNQAAYNLLRYGVPVKIVEAGKVTETVPLIDWREPERTTSPSALLPLLGDNATEVERMFLVIKAQSEY